MAKKNKRYCFRLTPERGKKLRALIKESGTTMNHFVFMLFDTLVGLKENEKLTCIQKDKLVTMYLRYRSLGGHHISYENEEHDRCDLRFYGWFRKELGKLATEFSHLFTRTITISDIIRSVVWYVLDESIPTEYNINVIETAEFRQTTITIPPEIKFKEQMDRYKSKNTFKGSKGLLFRYMGDEY